MVLNMPILCSTQMVGTTAGGMIRPASISMLMTPFHRLFLRCRTKATIAPRTTMTATLTTVRIVLLMSATTMM